MNVRDESGGSQKESWGNGENGENAASRGVDDFVLFIKHYFATFSAGADI